MALPTTDSAPNGTAVAPDALSALAEKGVDVAVWDEHPAPVRERVAGPVGHVVRDDGHAGRQRLEHHQRLSLVRAGEHKHIGGCPRLRLRIGDVTDPLDSILNAQLGRESAQFGARSAVAVHE